MNLKSNADALPERFDPTLSYQCAIIDANEILKRDAQQLNEFQMGALLKMIRAVRP